MMQERFSIVPLEAASSSLSARALRVLIAIASFANGDRTCHPGLSKIAEMTGIKRKKLPQIIAEIEKTGLITVERRRDDDGDAATNLYRISAVSSPTGTGVPAQGDTVSPPRGTGGVPSQGDQTDQKEQTIEQNPPPIVPPPGEKTSRGRKETPPEDAIALEFEEIWPLFPKRTGRKESLAAYRAARKKADRQTIEEAVRRFGDRERAEIAKGMDLHYVKTPAPWLNAERWLDEIHNFQAKNSCEIDRMAAARSRFPHISTERLQELARSPGCREYGPPGEFQAWQILRFGEVRT